MTQTTLVTNCLLYEDKNEQLYQYFEDVTPLFSFLVRRTIHHLTNDLNGEKPSEYRTRLKQEYKLTNRFVKAVVTSAQNLLKLSKASGEYLHSTYDIKLKKVNDKIIKTKTTLNNPKTKKSRIKNLKTKLFWLEMKKNRLLQHQNNGPRPMLTFGTKRLLKSDKSKFLGKRDNQIVYVGDKYDYKGNQQFQLFSDKKRNKFTYKLRLENNYIQDTKYLYGEFVIKDNLAKREILKTLNNPKSNPLTFRIIKKDKNLHLQIMYRMSSESKTRNSHGVLGVDFNKGFITISEIDEMGKLLNLHKLNYIHRTERKHYNRMIHTLKFGKFRDFLQTKCDKCGVNLSQINPYNTSKIASNKYCYNMKLNIHFGASYVIARRFYGLD